MPSTTFFFLITPPPPRSPLFPYTTLFRSVRQRRFRRQERLDHQLRRLLVVLAVPRLVELEQVVHVLLFDERERSEEHTSELQSQSNLVCRLLLEKKKDTNHEDILSPPSSL